MWPPSPTSTPPPLPSTSVEEYLPLTPPERIIKFWDDVLEDLSMSGYHRARVSTIPKVDRVIGGFCWALTTFDKKDEDGEGDIDFLYTENSKKTAQRFREECEDVIEVLREYECPHIMTVADILDQGLPKFADTLTWVLRNVLIEDSHSRNYDFFLGFFKKTYIFEQGAVRNFLRRLRRPHLRRIFSSDHYDRFDNAIIFDPALEGKHILAEYVNYGQTGRRIYPGHLEDSDGEDDDHDNVEIPRMRAIPPFDGPRVLGDKAEILFKNFESDYAKEVCEQSISTITRINSGKKISFFEKRLCKEAIEYHKKNVEFQKLKKEFTEAMATSSEIETPDYDGIKRKREEVQARAKIYYTETMKLLGKAAELEQKMRLNTNAKGKIQKYCPQKRDLLDKHVEKRVELEMKLTTIRKIDIRLDRAHDALEAERANRKRVIDIPEEMVPFSSLTCIDHRLADDASKLVSLCSTSITDIQRLHPREPGCREYRNAFIGYASDVRNTMTDWYWKAKAMIEKRKDLDKELRALHRKVKETQLKAVLDEAEHKALFQVTRAIQEMVSTLNRYEAVQNK